MTIHPSPSRNLRAKTEAIVTGHGNYPLLSLATLLHGGSLLYSGAMRLRSALYRKRYLPVNKLPCPVISVGNITVGGTGKTPMAIHLAQLLKGSGYGVVVVSRGYKSLSEKAGTVVSDGQTILCDAAHAGDEPYLMAHLLEGVPVVVGQDRHASGQTAWSRFNPDVVVLDDAFQHQRLARDLNLVLLDAKAPFGNGHLLPRGPLREPTSALQRADAFILTRSQDAPSPFLQDLIKEVQPRPVFQGFHTAVLRGILPAGSNLTPAALLVGPSDRAMENTNQRLFAFSGLARNERFWETAGQFGKTLSGTRGFNDHHPYTTRDMDEVVAAAQQTRSNCLVTTDKDFMRLPPNLNLPLDLMVLGVEIQFKGDRSRWRQFFTTWMEKIATAESQPLPPTPERPKG